MLIVGFLLGLLVRLVLLPLKLAVHILMAVLRVAVHILRAALDIGARFLHFIMVAILRRVVPSLIAGLSMIPGLLASKKLTKTMVVATIFEIIALPFVHPLALGIVGFLAVFVADHTVSAQPWVAKGRTGTMWGIFRGVLIVIPITISLSWFDPALGGFVAIAFGLAAGLVFGKIDEAVWKSVVQPA